MMKIDTSKLNNIEYVKSFVEQPDFDINDSIDRQNNTILLLILKNFFRIKNFIDILKYLLEKGADPNHINNNQTCPLVLIPTDRYVEADTLLVKYGANPNLNISECHTILTHACLRGNMSKIKFLLEHGADPNLKPKINTGRTPLEMAICNKSIEMVKLIVEHNASLDIYNQCDRIIYGIYEILHKNYDMLKYLLENGFDIDKYGNMYDPQKSIFLYYFFRMNTKTVALLLKHGVKFHIGENIYYFMSHNYRPYDFLDFQYGIIEKLKIVKQYGYDIINIIMENELPLLIEAIQHNMFILVKYLVEEIGIDINCEASGTAACQYAIDYKHIKLINYLYRPGMEIKINSYQTFKEILRLSSQNFMIDLFTKCNYTLDDFYKIIKDNKEHTLAVVTREAELYKKMNNEKLNLFRVLRDVIYEENIIDIILDYKEDFEKLEMMYEWFDKSLYN